MGFVGVASLFGLRRLVIVGIGCLGLIELFIIGCLLVFVVGFRCYRLFFWFGLDVAASLVWVYVLLVGFVGWALHLKLVVLCLNCFVDCCYAFGWLDWWVGV